MRSSKIIIRLVGHIQKKEGKSRQHKFKIHISHIATNTYVLFLVVSSFKKVNVQLTKKCAVCPHKETLFFLYIVVVFLLFIFTTWDPTRVQEETLLYRVCVACLVIMTL